MKSNNIFNEKLEKYEEFLITHRKETRLIWDKIIITSGVIIGFSVSITSYLESSLNLILLKVSWIFFLLNILVGFFLLIIDSGKTLWKNTKDTLFWYDYEELKRKYPAGGEEYDKRVVSLSFLYNKAEPHLSKYGKDFINKYKNEFGMFKTLKDLGKIRNFIYNSFGLFQIIFYIVFFLAILFIILSAFV